MVSMRRATSLALLGLVLLVSFIASGCGSSSGSFALALPDAGADTDDPTDDGGIDDPAGSDPITVWTLEDLGLVVIEEHDGIIVGRLGDILLTGFVVDGVYTLEYTDADGVLHRFVLVLESPGVLAGDHFVVTLVDGVEVLTLVSHVRMDQTVVASGTLLVVDQTLDGSTTTLVASGTAYADVRTRTNRDNRNHVARRTVDYVVGTMDVAAGPALRILFATDDQPVAGTYAITGAPGTQKAGQVVVWVGGVKLAAGTLDLVAVHGEGRVAGSFAGTYADEDGTGALHEITGSFDAAVRTAATVVE